MNYLKLSLGVFLLLSLFILNITSFSASKSYVKNGEKFEVSLSKIPSSSEVSWIISKDGKILDKINEKNLEYIFTENGDYIIRVNVKNTDEEVQSSIIELFVSESLPDFSPLKANLKSFPKIQDGVITLSGDSEDVTFYFKDSTGKITDYSFDSDIFFDSDDDGIIDNDIDNKDLLSKTKGKYFIKKYENTGIPSRAVLTVTDKDGYIDTMAVTIMFDDGSISKKRKLEDLSAKIHTLPESDKNGNILINKEGGELLLFSKDSTGKIKEYIIDKDSSLDSDLDGKTFNDFDNKNDNSSKDGSLYLLNLEKFDQQKKISLTVIDENGKKEVVKKNIIPKSGNIKSPLGNTLLVPLLFSSRTKILAEETITFKVFNIAPNSKISWDFNGDGIFEVEKSASTEVEYKFAKEGNFTVQVEILESGNIPIVEKKEIIVFNKNEGQIKTLPPKAYFLPQILGNKVSFLSSQSSADKNLLNTDLSFTWDFGDKYKTEGPNPIHIYEKEGEYIVKLIVEDSIERIGVYTEKIQIFSITEEFLANQHGGLTVDENNSKITIATNKPVDALSLETITPKPIATKEYIETNTPTEASSKPTPIVSIPPENNGSLSGDFSFPWWLILILIIIFIPIIFFLKKKIDNPERSLKDILDDFLHSFKKKEVKKDESVLVLDEKQEKLTKDENIEEEKVPDWMRDYDDELELQEEKESKKEEVVVENSKEENLTLPDWMKDTESVEKKEEVKIEEKESKKEEVVVENSKEENLTLPDWMKDAKSVEKEEVKIENNLQKNNNKNKTNNKNPNQNKKKVKKVPLAKKIIPKKEEVVVENIKEEKLSLPDWMKDTELVEKKEVKTDNKIENNLQKNNNKNKTNNKNLNQNKKKVKKVPLAKKTIPKKTEIKKTDEDMFLDNTDVLSKGVEDDPFKIDHPEWLDEIKKGDVDIKEVDQNNTTIGDVMDFIPSSEKTSKIPDMKNTVNKTEMDSTIINKLDKNMENSTNISAINAEVSKQNDDTDIPDWLK
jgi:PKD repeat protein